MSAYAITLTQGDVDSIVFVGGRYAWSDALRNFEPGENHLEEPEAWAVVEAFESDAEGGHEQFPMLHRRSDLACKLMAFWASIV